MTTCRYESGPYELDGSTRCRWHRHRTAEAAQRSAERYARRGGGHPAYIRATGGGATDAWWSGPDGVIHRVVSS